MTELIVFVALVGLAVVASVTVGMIVARWLDRRMDTPEPAPDGHGQPPDDPETR